MAAAMRPMPRNYLALVLSLKKRAEAMTVKTSSICPSART